ncbi:MAG: hypothetical protein ACM3S5_10335 [Rhodospirillales bacterium]
MIIELKTQPLGFRVIVPNGEYFAPLTVAGAQSLILAMLAAKPEIGGELDPKLAASIEAGVREAAEGDASFLRSVGVQA